MWHLRKISFSVFVLPIVDVRVTSTFPPLWKGTTLLIYLLLPALSMNKITSYIMEAKFVSTNKGTVDQLQ